MRSDVAKDMSWSAIAFKKQVFPAIHKFIGGGDLLQVEGNASDSMRLTLDQQAGIDAWQIVKHGMRGIGARCQVDRDYWAKYETFTVRMSRPSGALTEYAKRRLAIFSENGFLFPHLTIHAYFDGDTLDRVGICRTRDLIDMIDAGYCQQNRTATGEVFAVIKWDEFRRMLGYRFQDGGLRCLTP